MEHPPLFCEGPGLGPDERIRVPAPALAVEAWGGKLRANAREKVTFGRADLYENAELFVQTAVLRAPTWKEGAKGPRIRSAADLAKALEHTTRLDHERVIVTMLDEDWHVVALHEAAVGGLHGCALTPRDCLRLPVLLGVPRIIVSHNHPSGDPAASPDDIRMTHAIARAAKAVGVELVDHVVLARNTRRSIYGELEYTSIVGEVAHGSPEYGTGFPPGADRVLADAPTPALELALRPFGKLAKFLVRSALIEASTPPRGRPSVGRFEDVLELGVVRQLQRDADGPERLVTICVDGKNNAMAIHVTEGAIHGVSVRRVYAVCSTVPTAAVIFAHNHPDGSGLGTADYALAEEIGKGMDAIGVAVLDHVLLRTAEAPASFLEAGVKL